MSWAVGFDGKWNRDIGYGVPAICDRPGCGEEIDRGLSFVCGGEPYGGGHGCGLFFCEGHLWWDGERQRCDRCTVGEPPFEATPDTLEWIEWKLTDESWVGWRAGSPETVKAMQTHLLAAKEAGQ